MRWFFPAFVSLFLIPLPAFGAGVLLQEILFDPEGTDTGKEWITLRNAGTEEADLSGWQLYPDGIGYYAFPGGFALSAGSSATVRLRLDGADSQTILFHKTASSNMGNTSGSAALFSGEPRGKETIRSFMQWGRAGETWESAAAEAGIWIKGEFADLSSFVPGASLQRIADSIGKNAWQINFSPSPAHADIPEGKPPAETKNPAPPETDSLPVPSSEEPIPPPSFSADAGKDRDATVGTPVSFEGSFTILRESLSGDVRFFWDFGDGKTAEGIAVSHVFSLPGIYRVGLHVSHGDETRSDYVSVRAAPNNPALAEVIGRAGKPPQTKDFADKREQTPDPGDSVSSGLAPDSLSFLRQPPEEESGEKLGGQKNAEPASTTRSQQSQKRISSSPGTSDSGGEDHPKEETPQEQRAQASSPLIQARTFALFALAFVVSAGAAGVFLFLRTALP